MKYVFTCIVAWMSVYPAEAQVKGCTDYRAFNYNAAATENDGSCLYEKTSYTQKEVCPKLSDTVSESSGLIYWAGMFWTINDSGNPPCLYAIDSSSGAILHTSRIKGVNNTDWEDLAQDSQYFYIGDFGNNLGGRKDLSILKISKNQINLSRRADSLDAEIIRFSMADQTNYNHSAQSHDYDMEAFCSIGDSLHLFSKNWLDYKTRHYVCPKDPGLYHLLPVETINVEGQVTGACHKADGVCVLTGYTKNFQGSFIVLLWDYKHNLFNHGNRRRIQVGNLTVPGQNEAICFNGSSLYMSNEKQISEAALHRLHTEQWTYKPLNLQEKSLHLDGAIRISITGNQILVEAEPQMFGKSFQIFDATGHSVLTNSIKQPEETIDISGLPAGLYLVYAYHNFLRKIVIH